jgi:hypothetical protein
LLIIFEAYIYDRPVDKMDVLAQLMVLLGIVCNVVMGLSTEPCDFIISAVTLIAKMAMATGLGKDTQEYNGYQCYILDQFPTSLYTAFNRFNIDGQVTTYAVCPACNYTHKPSYEPATATAHYPTRCTNQIVGDSGTSVCHTELLERRNGHLRPIKPYLVASFAEYLARILSDAKIEQLCDDACDDAFISLSMPPEPNVTNTFRAEFMRTFEGPVRKKLFIDRGNKVRLAFALQTDFFNPNGTRKRGNHDSVGIVSVALLNLPAEIRYKPENMYLSIIPGPREPDKEEFYHFLRPIIDEFVVGWDRGFHISRTGSSPEYGRDVETAIVLSINDLPAARKASGTAGTGSDFYCTLCNGHGRRSMYNSDFDNWEPRDILEMRKQAEAWRDAQTLEERNDIFKRYGVRWSEFWRLSYWDPGRMLVVDCMHCLLEGLVCYHCRHVLQLHAKQGTKHTGQSGHAFSYPWTSYSSDVPSQYCVKNDKEVKHIYDIQGILVLPVNDGPASLKLDELKAKLTRKNLTPLKYVCYSLDLSMEIPCGNDRLAPAKTKKHFADILANWVSSNISWP